MKLISKTSSTVCIHNIMIRQLEFVRNMFSSLYRRHLYQSYCTRVGNYINTHEQSHEIIV